MIIRIILFFVNCIFLNQNQVGILRCHFHQSICKAALGEQPVHNFVALKRRCKDSDPYTEHPIAILNYLQSVKRSRTLTSTEQAEILSLIEAAQDNESIYVGAYLLLDNPVAAKIHFDKLPEESQKFFESCPIYHFMPNGQPTISAPTEG